MNNMGTQCGGVLWRQEVVENDVEAKSEEGRTYDLTFWKFSEVVVGFRVVEVIELSKVPSCRVCWSGIGCWSKNCILNQRIAVERESVCVWDVLMQEGQDFKLQFKSHGWGERRLLRFFASPKECLRQERKRNMQNDPENLRNWPWWLNGLGKVWG